MDEEDDLDNEPNDNDSNEQVEQQINTFLDQFDESQLEQQRMQRWSNQTQQGTRPVYLRNVIEGFSPQGQPRTSGMGSLVENLMGTRSAQSREPRVH